MLSLRPYDTGMIASPKNTLGEYLKRAKELRATAAQVRDRRAREALIHAAEAYERMSKGLSDPGEQD